MGRKRIFATNAERQRHFQQVKKEQSLQTKIEAALKTNVSQVTQKVENFESIVNRYFYGKTLQQVKEAYNHRKELYQSIGVNVDFQEIHHYLEDDTPLCNGINLGEIEQFLSCVENHIECSICGYFFSHFESKGCPECSLKIHDYPRWKNFRKEFD